MRAPIQICLVDDTADYRFLVEVIFHKFLPAYSLSLFVSGQAFMDALPHWGTNPNLILLDRTGDPAAHAPFKRVPNLGRFKGTNRLSVHSRSDDECRRICVGDQEFL